MIQNPQPPAISPEEALGRAIGLYVGWACLLSAGGAFVGSFLVERKKKSGAGVEVHTARAASAISIPTGFALLYCAIKPTVFPYIPGVNYVLFIAALAFIFVAVKSSMR